MFFIVIISPSFINGTLALTKGWKHVICSTRQNSFVPIILFPFLIPISLTRISSFSLTGFLGYIPTIEVFLSLLLVLFFYFFLLYSANSTSVKLFIYSRSTSRIFIFIKFSYSSSIKFWLAIPIKLFPTRPLCYSFVLINKFKFYITSSQVFIA